MKSKNSEYNAKIIAWDKYSKIYGKKHQDKNFLKKMYREVLNGDLNRIAYIVEVEGNIKTSKQEIESEKKKAR